MEINFVDMPLPCLWTNGFTSTSGICINTIYMMYDILVILDISKLNCIQQCLLLIIPTYTLYYSEITIHLCVISSVQLFMTSRFYSDL